MEMLMPMRDGRYARIPDLEEQSSRGGRQEDAIVASRQEAKAEVTFKQPHGLWAVIPTIFIVTLAAMLFFDDGRFGRLMSTGNVPFETREHPDPPKNFWKDLKGPLPTGAFWTNFVTEEGQAPANLHPYGIKCLRDGVQTSYNPTRRVVNELVMSDPFDNDLELSAAEEYKERKIKDYDSLSVTMRYNLINGASYSAHLVKGAPYVTVSYSGATPVVKAPNMQIINVEERGSDGKKLGDLEPTPVRYRNRRRRLDGGAGHGKAYLLDLGNFQKWLVYVSDPNAALVWDKAGNSMTSATSMASGFVRIAILPPLKDEASVDKAFNFLLRHVGTYPTGAQVDLTYSKNGSSGTMTYVFTTDGEGGPAPLEPGRSEWWPWSGWFRDQTSGDLARARAPPLLMYALPHHVKALSEKSRESVSEDGMASLPSMYSLKGRLTPLLGPAWSMSYTLPDEGWDYYMRHDVPSEQLDVIATQLISDISNTNKESEAPDSYTFGKEVSRMAVLAGLADYLGILNMRDQALDILREWVTPWLEGTNDDKFVYDNSYGGLVTEKGIADKMADYGLGWYNDHHFHYGYHIYAYAMVARFDRAFLSKHKEAMDAVVADVCYHHQRDGGKVGKFPYVRHKDLWDGHSWASGIFSMGNGKGQESSSEAVNAYYACYLYGRTIGDTDLKLHSQFMLALEVEAVKMYWHMPNSEVYDSFFASNVMVGNVGAFDVTCTTWFGSNLEYVHGIQIMPVTPATGLLLEPSFVKKEWPLLADRLPESERGPSSSKATNSALGVPYRRELVSISCADSPKCAALGLVGDCCPNTAGVTLDCCASGGEGKGEGKEGGGGRPETPHPPYTPTPQTDTITEEWRAIMFMDLAVIDRDAAFQNLVKLGDEIGPGASKTNALMWAISRPQPISHVKAAHKADHTAPQECAKISACDANGMLGDCCPNDDGGDLSCCPKITGILQA